MFFETPTQVKFWDADGGHYTAGIAYKDEIICGWTFFGEKDLFAIN
jgi:hypothetical protein